MSSRDRRWCFCKHTGRPRNSVRMSDGFERRVDGVPPVPRRRSGVVILATSPCFCRERGQGSTLTRRIRARSPVGYGLGPANICRHTPNFSVISVESNCLPSYHIPDCSHTVPPTPPYRGNDLIGTFTTTQNTRVVSLETLAWTLSLKEEGLKKLRDGRISSPRGTFGGLVPANMENLQYF